MQSDLSVIGLRGGALHRTVQQQLSRYFDTSLGKSRDSLSKRSDKVEMSMTRTRIVHPEGVNPHRGPSSVGV